MKLPFTIYDLRFTRLCSASARRTICKKSSASVAPNRQSSIANRKSEHAFTMVEIAISLAIIGIALVAIIGVLPIGLKMQRANREQTLINQDATVLMEAIRNGAAHSDDLTNYIFAITNTYVGVTYLLADDAQFSAGEKIIGLLSAPEFVDKDSGNPVAEGDPNSISNHMVAFVRSMSGLAVEKPPQPSNSLIRESSFSYGVGYENIQLYTPPAWRPTSYQLQDKVSFPLGDGQQTYWQLQSGSGNNAPTNNSSGWVRDRFDEEMAANSHEMRLTFLWPLLPDSQAPARVHYGPGHWTYRATVAGQLVHKKDTAVTPNLDLYFFQPQSFATNAP